MSNATEIQQRARAMADDILDWASREKFATYDWWDMWGHQPGRAIKRLYHRWGLAAAPLVAPLLVVDFLTPEMRRYLVAPRSFPISHAHFALGCVQLQQATGEGRYMDFVPRLLRELMEMRAPSPTGLAWGMKHEWTTIQGVVPRDTPCHTQSAYAYQLFSLLHDLRGRDEDMETVRRIAIHEACDFP